MIHKGRYYTNLKNPPHMRPPIALRYAMWAIAASVTDKYVEYEDILYQRARKYIEQAEMTVRQLLACRKRHSDEFRAMGRPL
jgi:hypothetical protein